MKLSTTLNLLLAAPADQETPMVHDVKYPIPEAQNFER